MKQELEAAIAGAVKELFGVDQPVELTRPDEQFGDYATNAVLQLAGKQGKNPREAAEQLAVKIRENLVGTVSDVSVAGPGFLNLRLTDQALAGALQATPDQPLKDQVVVAEYSDPNPFKVLHAGHLYTSVVGDAVANLMQNAGATVHRVNFGGDVGLHVGKTLWAIIEQLGGELPDKLADIPAAGRSEWMASCYVLGTNTYEDDESAKAAIGELNKRVYRIHAEGDHDSPLAKIYWTCRGWSYDYFDAFYASIGSHFEKYYPESSVADLGLQTVREQLAKGVFKESDGAVVFDGEKYGLHTRVFINSEGIPTYEAKDVGLIMQKYADYHFDKSVVITGNEQEQYMAVVLKAVEQFAPELVMATSHLTHGLVKLAGGVKMSSRRGNILRAVDVLDAAREAGHKLTGQDNEDTVLGAVKYAFLKTRTGGDIIYDPAESVSLQGNSGPYLQYAHARARSILVRANASPPSSGAQLRSDAHVPSNVRSASVLADHPDLNDASLALNSGTEGGPGSFGDRELQAGERSLLRKITEYPEAVERATAELMPHHVCTYLYELAQIFNSFYEHNRVIGNERQPVRLQLVGHYADTLRHGLQLLGIPAPEHL